MRRVAFRDWQPCIILSRLRLRAAVSKDRSLPLRPFGPEGGAICLYG